MEACGRTPWSWRRQLSMTICAARSEEKIAPSRSSSRRRALKLSMKEALDQAVLPRAAGCDVGRACADGCDPVLHGFGHERGAVVGSDVPWNAASHEQVRQRVDDVDGFEPAADPDGQALVGELIADVEHAELAPLMGDHGGAPRRSRRTTRDCGARP